jgi:hypothetical protein
VVLLARGAVMGATFLNNNQYWHVQHLPFAKTSERRLRFGQQDLTRQILYSILRMFNLFAIRK